VLHIVLQQVQAVQAEMVMQPTEQLAQILLLVDLDLTLSLQQVAAVAQVKIQPHKQDRVVAAVAAMDMLQIIVDLQAQELQGHQDKGTTVVNQAVDLVVTQPVVVAVLVLLAEPL
jgi:hypothetical protein